MQVTLDGPTLTPSSTVHANSVHLGLAQGPVTFSVMPKIGLIKSDQFDAPVDAYVESLQASFEVELLQSSMTNLATALGVGTYLLSAGNYAHCTFGGTNQPPTICVAAIAPRRTVTTDAVVGCLYRVNAAEGISWTAQRNKTSTFKVKFSGQSDTTRTAGRQIGIFHELGLV
jgi:hypothetical protein